MNIEIVPILNSGDEEDSNLNNESPHHHEGTTAVIENIDTITNNSNNNDEDGGILSASISDNTSVTSIASTLSDGNPRPRSASLHITPSNNHHNNGDRPSSIPRLRPRSNPRTRTPMRHESPLLVISPIVAAAGSAIIAENNITGGGIANHHRSGSEATAQLEDGDANNNEQLIRNIFHTRSSRARRLRAGSIPEEIVEDDGSTIVVDDNTSFVAANNDNIAAGNQATNNESTTTVSSTSAATNNSTTTRTAGRFFTQAVATTSTRRRRNNRTTEPNNTTQQQQRTLSTKQNPSHRKIRRWKNDAFIGTPSEHVHTMLMTKGGEEEGWNEFPYMPNHPLEYNSEFSKLSVDRSRGGEKVRERFVRGEVASGDFALKKGGSGVDDEEEVGEEVMMQRRIVAKCRQLGIPPKVIMDESKWGEVLYDKLGLRIQSILSRSCSSVDTNASRIVATFESYLVSLALNSKVMTGNDDDNVELGFPPLQPQAVYDVFQDILASPPRIVMRNKQSSSSNNSNCNNQRIGKAAVAAKEVSGMNKCGVLIPTTHFYFPTEGQDGSSRRSSAFHRILLYAVCQFHGLETSSSVVPDKKLKRDDNGRRKGQQQKQNRNAKGSMKVVTVQSGVLLAPSIKLLDFVCT